LSKLIRSDSYTRLR